MVKQIKKLPPLRMEKGPLVSRIDCLHTKRATHECSVHYLGEEQRRKVCKQCGRGSRAMPPKRGGAA